VWYASGNLILPLNGTDTSVFDICSVAKLGLYYDLRLYVLVQKIEQTSFT
jgi:hypothetical protein